MNNEWFLSNDVRGYVVKHNTCGVTYRYIDWCHVCSLIIPKYLILQRDLLNGGTN